MTRGLMGTWDYDATNDFTSPDGTPGTSSDTNNLRSTHDWAMKCKSIPYLGKKMLSFNPALIGHPQGIMCIFLCALIFMHI